MKRSLPQIDENAFYTAASQHHSAGRLKEARDLYRAILTQNTKHAGAIFGMGTLAMQVEQYEKAVDYIKQAIKIGPATAPMYINLGAALRHAEKNKEAVTAYDKAIKIDALNAAAFYNKGRALQELQKYSEAGACYKRAIHIDDSDADAWVNLGTVQMETEETDKALYSFERAARLAPEIGAPYGNAAAILFDRAHYEIAMVLINKALEVEPDNTEWRHQLSSFFLTAEDFERGWVDFDLRFTENEKARKYRRPEPPAYWDGKDLDILRGKKFLIWTEQGFGEEILSTTLLPDLIQTGAEFSVECSPRMVPVLQKAFPKTPITSWTDHAATVNEANPPFDFQYPALSLMKIFRSTTDSIASRPNVIEPDSDVRTRLRNKYEKLADGRKIIGLSWRSSNSKLGPSKSIPLMDWEIILKTESVLFVSLQYGDCASDIKNVNRRLGLDIFKDPEVDPSSDLAPVLAQIAAMDLVITISNSNAHFAGALGVPTWMMIPKGRGQLWFWFHDRLSSPWYSSLRLFRQTTATTYNQSTWPEVIEQVAAALPEWLSQSENTPQSSSELS